jgi:hypothetical protein
VGRGEQVGGAQDEQGGGEVTDLEQREGTQQPAELAVQDRADPDPQGAVSAYCVVCSVVYG